ncbi:MAG TPA: AAA family ATPase [Actinomycetota bacterium]|nr:AAA family ATPase [Actinomycetota bacterium]
MDTALYETIIERLDRDPRVSDVAELVLAACEGREGLEAFLRGTGSPRRRDGGPAERRRPVQAYLRSVTVEGFRGIGARATLELVAAPGLTLVVGRNGTGKSSFAEGLEVLFTGDSYRWRDRVKAWRDGWKNLHHQGPVSVTAELVTGAGRGTTTVTRTWSASATDVEDSEAWVQPSGERRAGLETLGWEDALETFRPFLTYSELGSMLEEGPSKLYDALSSILGLGELVEVAEVLRGARLDRERRDREATEQLVPLRQELERIEDERARACLRALTAKPWDLEEIERRTLGQEPFTEEGELALLQKIALLEIPSEERVAETAQELEAAADGLDHLAGTDADRAASTADLLERALRFHEHHGDGDCPVCGRAGALNDEWRRRSEEEVERLRGEARAVERAREAAARAWQHARALLQGPPPFLLESEGVGVPSRELREAWGAWEEGAALEDPRALAQHLRERWPELSAAAAEAKARAAEILREREDRWRPMAQRLAAFVEPAREAQEGARHVPALKKAERWVKDLQSEIRDERFRPIAAQALEIWSLLRTRSNVELARPSLEGTGTRRRVRLDVTVDGVAGAALGVMSQGELHSLALSLFLPRVTMRESPFRFIVIDDPVQSMDPARVDGLARVLEQTARTHQVIVFTHDDRLPASVRRLGIGAHVISVSRKPESVVEVRPVLDPVTRYFEDARAIVRTDDLPEEVRRRVLPGLCRLGIEAACMETVRRRRIAAGAPHEEVEDLLANAKTTTTLAALALFDDPDRGGDVLAEINRRFGGREADAFSATKKGAHHGFDGDPRDLVRYSESLARSLRDLR